MTDSSQQSIHRIVLEALPVGVYAVNRQGKIILWSAGAEHITGYLRQDVLGRLREEELLEQSESENDPPQGAPAALLETVREGRAVAAQLYLRSKTGQSIPVQFQSVPLRDDLGRNLGAAKIFAPISVSAIGNRRHSKLGPYGCLDALTGVLNHSMIQAHLKECLSLYTVYPVPFSVLCFAIDNLDKLRERYGQAAVDATLLVVAQTIEHGLRPSDFLGRLLEEEFLAILTECSEADVAKVGHRLSRLVQHAGVSWWGDTFHVSVSIGATTAHDPDTVGSIVSRAEEALRESCAAGGNRVVVIAT
jgi:diguanylate cyclase (GGDEF)-like protein/PAS domain S-box-containing protein